MPSVSSTRASTYMSSCMGIDLSVAGIGVGLACWRCVGGLACRRCVSECLDFAIGGILDGVFMLSCIGTPGMPDIASCFSIMPSADIAPPLADMGGWLDACPVSWA